jgi:succinate-acetate transporter protein
MSTSSVGAPPVTITTEAPPVAPAAAAGDPQVLGLPAFAVGSIALGLALVGYVPVAAQTAALPIIFAMTGIGLLISTIWAAALGQTMVATVFGLFSGFWLSYTILVVGLGHAWWLIPGGNVSRSIQLFLISWAVLMFCLTIATLRLPVAYTAVVGLVTVALVLLIFGTSETSDTLNKAAGYVTLVFAALGLYLFLGAADKAAGGNGYPLGEPLRR